MGAFGTRGEECSGAREFRDPIFTRTGNYSLSYGTLFEQYRLSLIHV